MCLTKTHTFPKISSKPITCYKIVAKINNNSFFSFHAFGKYKLNKPIKHAKLSFGLFSETLGGEVVHAYANKDTACKYIKALRKLKLVCKDECIVECIIPPFTLYWEGYGDEIGARKIIPKRFLNKKEKK